MKKIMAVLLSAVLLCSAFCINTSAAEKSKEKQKLGYLINLWYLDNQWVGIPSVYIGYIQPELSNAEEVYNNENSTDYECAHASSALLNDYMNYDVIPGYARETYKIAVKEQNYNNWYTDEQWNNFQSKLSDLGATLETVDEGEFLSRQITKKFHAMLKAYNEMTNAYTVKGDLNKDGTVNILDVTLLQKYLANSVNLTGAQKMLAGAREYENPTITDVTIIQKYAVGQITEIPNNNVFISDRTDDFFSYVDTDFLMESIVNYTICPRVLQSVGLYAPLENNYTGRGIVFAYYKWCAENGCEP